MNILISGYYGFDNVGDEAVLLAIINGLKQKIRSADITVLSQTPYLTAKQYNVTAIGRGNWSNILSAIKACDVFISGGGSLLQNVTSNRSLFYYLSLIKTAKTFGKKVVIFSQGFGPVNGFFAKQIARHILNKVNLIMLRDQNSFDQIIQMGIKQPPVCLTADIALTLDLPDKNAGQEVLKSLNIKKEKPFLGIAVRDFKSIKLDTLHESIDIFCQKYGFVPLFIPFHPVFDNDTSAGIMQQLKTKSYLAIGRLSVYETMALFSQLDILIGMRLHALIFCIMAQVPSLGLSYDPKVASFMQETDQPFIDLARGIDTREILLRLDEIMNNKRNLAARAQQLKDKANLNFDLLAEKIFLLKPSSCK